MKGLAWVILSLTLFSCGGNTRKLTSASLPAGNTYQVNHYVGCCGCEADYFDIKTGNKTLQQVIFKYNCGQGGAGSPTKYVFYHDAKGRIEKADKYVATTSDDFSIPLTADEKKVFQSVDSTGALSRILGFRLARPNEPNHPFPLIKNGHKIKLGVDGKSETDSTSITERIHDAVDL